MNEAWKWTNAAQQTRGGEPPTMCQWGEGVKHTVVPYRGVLCEAGVIHCYDDAILAVMINPAHRCYSQGGGLLWLCEWSGRTAASADKRGVETLRTLHVVTPPVLSTEQRIEIAIRASLVVLPVARRWAEGAGRGEVLASLDVVAAWATRWLDGTDRSEAASDAAVRAANAAGSAADAAVSAAYAARWAANAAVSAANAAVSAANAAVSAANAAWWAVYAAGMAGIPLDLVAICREMAGR